MTDNSRKFIILTAPSGTGKTTIARYLLNKYPQLAFSVSATTRTARANERDGVDYYFISSADFQQKIDAQEFVEWEMVYEGKYYGTLKAEFDRIWQAGKIPILDIDVKGALQVKRKYQDASLSIFIEPPSMDELKRRLELRGTETPESLQMRLSKAGYEVSFKHLFDRVIINNDLDSACTETEQAICTFLGIQQK